MHTKITSAIKWVAISVVLFVLLYLTVAMIVWMVENLVSLAQVSLTPI